MAIDGAVSEFTDGWGILDGVMIWDMPGFGVGVGDLYYGVDCFDYLVRNEDEDE